jgi:hypothetical protein
MDSDENDKNPRWEFDQHGNDTWTWRSLRDGHTVLRGAISFSTWKAVTTDAARCGFSETMHHYVVRAAGRITHFRPGEPVRNLPDCFVPPQPL